MQPPPRLSQVKRRLSSRQFSWLSVLRSSNLPRPFGPVACSGFAPRYSGGTAPVLHRSSLLSPVGHLLRIYSVVKIKLFPWQEEESIHIRPSALQPKAHLLSNLLPIARGSNGDCQTGSSPGSGSSLLQPSQAFRPSGVFWIRSPLQWRDRAGLAPVFPIKPRRAPASPSSGLFIFTI